MVSRELWEAVVKQGSDSVKKFLTFKFKYWENKRKAKEMEKP